MRLRLSGRFARAWRNGATARPDPAAEVVSDEPALDPTAEVAPDEPALEPAPNAAPPVVVPRWVQLVMLPLALLGLWALARAAGVVVLILIAASTLALILSPVVRVLHNRGVP